MDTSKLYIIYTIIFIWLMFLTITVILIKSNVTLLEVFEKIKSIIFDEEIYTDEDEVEKIMRTAGYDYDKDQDIFYSREDAWQKSYGYCRLYDEAASSFSLIIDSEPIYFEYGGKKWLIEFWKGQYGMCSGGEVGIYNSSRNDDNFTRLFKTTYYDANDESNIKIKMDFYKNDKKIFTREGSYWWITGFMLGEFSEPKELSMDIEITFPNKDMLKAFVKGLNSEGYFDDEFEVKGNTVRVEFKEPHTIQPKGRIEMMDNLQQLKNKMLCDHYKLLLDPELNSFDNLVRLKKIESSLFDTIEDFSRSHNLLYIYENTKKYIE